jgi:hypothetical protein
VIENKPRRPTDAAAKHHAHLAPSYVAHTIRAHFPTLGIAGDTTVTTMKGESMALGSLEVWILA